MRTCLVCNDTFKTCAIINGVKKNLGSRKRCLKCSPWNTHNTSDINSKKVGDKYLCLRCNKEFILDRSKGHRSKQCNSCTTVMRRYRVKQKCLEYKGNKCETCGYSKCPAALEFHHVDESTKTFTIGGAYNRSWASIAKELDKCKLLCGNCHSEYHYKGHAPID